MRPQQMKPWSELTPSEQARYGNGIGPHWFPNVLRRWITDFCSQFFREASWRRHDYGYHRGGSELHRIRCDGLFLVAMRRDVYRSPWYWKPLTWLLAHLFYIAVRLFGWASFNYHDRSEHPPPATA